ncbi:VTT domain-containing protein [Candidatus Parabeggiatoa sp. HSG14]|uniref:TVP38/TMEM64 family protein n=1 Tax=Candidatus Parabeggiatoa sp. HSG14 TaxID=3055593 RepID=UPI0025A75AA1|nr:VTT domain-containing protein [Thiotrichales bacterium HSG14]
MVKTIIQRFLLGIWMIVLFFGLWYYWFYPELFTTQNLKVFFERFNTLMLWVYLLVSIVRGFALIPSTPFVFAGLLLFSWEMVFLISMIGILASATLLYFFAEFLEFDQFLEKKYPQEIKKLKHLMQRKGVVIVFLWSFFPAVPTDLICYVAGILRMPFGLFLLALGLGESILVGLYVFLGTTLMV